MGLDLPQSGGLGRWPGQERRLILDVLGRAGVLALSKSRHRHPAAAARSNPKPRLFRYPEAEAIINRMGFNNDGVDALVDNIKRSRFQGVLGINIGKNALTPMERAVDDYLTCLNKAYLYASYVTINISSPNTKKPARPAKLDRAVRAAGPGSGRCQLELAQQHGRYVPLGGQARPGSGR